MEVRIDLTNSDGPVRPVWSFGGNTCHAPLLLRPDLQRHLAAVRRDLGFTHVRCHNWLGDQMGVMLEPGKFDFTKITAACEALVDLGLKPFIEFSGMPGCLASNDKALCRYRMRTAPPTDWALWAKLVNALTAHLTDHFGQAEVRQWHFEAWNEPDLAFWSGSQREFFRLYDLAAASVKQVCPDYRVGGPATARTAWIDEFLDHLARPSDDFALAGVSRCDFISTHAYPSDIAFVDSDQGQVNLQSSNIMRELFVEVRRKVDAALGDGFPVICGEWNSSAGPLAENHDTANNAAFIVKTMVELGDLCDGSLYWNISDIYEECGFHHEPFHGGYGLLTVNDIPKASFHGFAFLNRHRGRRATCGCRGAVGSVGAYASVEGSEWVVTVYHHLEFDEDPVPIDVTIHGLPDGRHAMRTIAPGAGSAYEAFVEAGSPAEADAVLLAGLEAASRPKQSTTPADVCRFTLAPGTVVQIEGKL